MSKIFDEQKGYLTPLAREAIERLQQQLNNLAGSVVDELEINGVPNPEWNLFMLYYKEQVYTTLLERSVQRQLKNKLASKS